MNAFGSARPEFRRAKNGRPYIKTPDGKERTYTRVTTYIDVLEDKTTLSKWLQRQAMVGMTKSPVLVKSVKAAHAAGDKDTMEELREKALTLAGADDKASEGTAMHSLTELIDMGQPLPEGLDALTLRDLAAYQEGRAGLTALDIEASVVHHELQTAGTFDRRDRVEPGFEWPAWLEGKIVVGDLKSGRVDYGLAKMAMQIGTYANSERYNIATGETSPLEVDRTVGLIYHLPLAEGRLDVYALDIGIGWQAVHLARQVRDFRAFARRTSEFSQLVRSVDLAARDEAAA